MCKTNCLARAMISQVKHTLHTAIVAHSHVHIILYCIRILQHTRSRSNTFSSSTAYYTYNGCINTSYGLRKNARATATLAHVNVTMSAYLYCVREYKFATTVARRGDHVPMIYMRMITINGPSRRGHADIMTV